MKPLLNTFKSIVCIFLLVFCSCNPANKNKQANKAVTNSDIEDLEFTVEEALEWNALFKRTSGWFGADGIFAIPLNGKDNIQASSATKSLLLFSDTMVGEVLDGELQQGWGFINNSAAYLKGSESDKDKISFHWDKDEDGNPKTLFIPNTPSSEKEDWYWMGDGFVNTELNNTTYIFAHRMRSLNTGEEWAFKQTGTNLIAVPAESDPPFKDHRQIETPLELEEGGWGAGIYVNTQVSGAPDPDGYVYVYGASKNNLMVARVIPEDFENFNAWQFWDGEKWDGDMQKVAPVTQNVSNELSVTALPDGRYALVFQENGLSPIVGLRLGLTPYGPFGPIIKLYEAKEMQQKNYTTYNAKAHPSLSAPGELLISYNVNAFDIFNEIKANPNLYRPRFLRVKLK